MPGKDGKKKKKHVSLREQMKLAKKGVQVADAEEKKTDDPVGSCSAEWFKEAKGADKWKPKWECMQHLMEYATGDSFGNQAMPDRFAANDKAAGEVMAYFAKWLNDETGHLFTRKHILRLLLPFGRSYGKGAWKKHSSLARGIMQKQWMEKAPNFLPYVTPALIAVYIASQAKLLSWKDELAEALSSEQPQIRMSGWDFLAKLCMIGDLRMYDVTSSRTSKDVKDVLNHGSMMKSLRHALLEDQDKATRDAAAKFVYAARNLCGGAGKLDMKSVSADKRAQMALDMAPELFKRDERILQGLSAPSDEQLAKKAEAKQAKSSAKVKRKHANNMRAQMMAAKRRAKKMGGGGGAIQVVGGKDDDDDDGGTELVTVLPPSFALSASDVVTGARFLTTACGCGCGCTGGGAGFCTCDCGGGCGCARFTLALTFTLDDTLGLRFLFASMFTFMLAFML
mmetsp:Transcript_55699/g.92684  ORF Transcript_55699/g.92684 Transcript_55699/m.92684 type:complete len:453 (+) Transcript_55699:72-1430(+)